MGEHEVLIVGSVTATDRRTGTSRAEAIAMLFRVESGRIRRMDLFLDISRARRRAGLE